MATDIDNIDQERLCNDEHIPKEFFCSICLCLLWKPRSCAKCQNLFCQACISRWLRTDSKCPFGCPQYEDRNCPPQIRSLLSNFTIRCQSFQYGCTAVLSYDRLEAHQTRECAYPATRCQYCEALTLSTSIDAHELECGRRLGNCSICNQLIPLYCLQEHESSCLVANTPQNLYPMADHQNLRQIIRTIEMNNPTRDIPIVIANIFAPTPDDRNIQNEYYNMSWWQRIGSLVNLILTNPFDTPHILLIVWFTGLGCILGQLLGGIIAISGYCSRNICIGFLLITFFVGLLHSTAPWLLNIIDDTSTMIAFTTLFLLTGSRHIHFSAHYLRNRDSILFTLLEYILCIVSFKLVLLFLRFYFHWIPAYVTATAVSGVIVILALVLRFISTQL